VPRPLLPALEILPACAAVHGLQSPPHQLGTPTSTQAHAAAQASGRPKHLLRSPCLPPIRHMYTHKCTTASQHTHKNAQAGTQTLRMRARTCTHAHAHRHTHAHACTQTSLRTPPPAGHLCDLRPKPEGHAEREVQACAVLLQHHVPQAGRGPLRGGRGRLRGC